MEKHNTITIKKIIVYLLFTSLFYFSLIIQSQAKNYDISMDQVMNLYHEGQISFFVWSPDSSKLAVSSQDDTLITLWDLTTRTPIWKIKKLLGVSVGGKDLEFGPDGNTIITGSATSIGITNIDIAMSIISAKNGEIIQDIRDYNHEDEPVRPWNLITSRDKTKLFAAIGNHGQISVYDTKTWQKIDEIGPVISHYRMFGGIGRPGGIRRLAFDEVHNLLFVSVSDGHIQAWDTIKHIQYLDLKPYQVDVTDMVLSPANGDLIVGGSGNINGYPKSSPPSGVISPNTFLYIRDDPKDLESVRDHIVF